MSLKILRYASTAAAAMVVLWAVGCKSAFIAATVTNGTGGAVSEIEIDYPSAGFGTSTLAPNGVYHYRFELIGDGPLKATWTDAAKKAHSATGPTVQEGQRGTLEVTLEPDGTALWKPQLTR